MAYHFLKELNHAAWNGIMELLNLFSAAAAASCRCCCFGRGHVVYDEPQALYPLIEIKLDPKYPLMVCEIFLARAGKKKGALCVVCCQRDITRKIS